MLLPLSNEIAYIRFTSSIHVGAAGLDLGTVVITVQLPPGNIRAYNANAFRFMGEASVIYEVKTDCIR